MLFLLCRYEHYQTVGKKYRHLSLEVNIMNKKRIVLIVFCVVIFLLLLWLVYKLVTPARTYLNLEMVCTEVAADGTVLSTGNTVTIKGWETERKDSRDCDLLIDEFTLPAFSTSLKPDTNVPITVSYTKPSPHAAFGPVYDGNGYDLDHLHNIYISFETDWKTCLIQLNGERFFACSLDGTIAVSEILETHKWILPE